MTIKQCDQARSLTRAITDAIGKSAPEHILPYVNELTGIVVGAIRRNESAELGPLLAELQHGYTLALKAHGQEASGVQGAVVDRKLETRDLLIEMRALVRVLILAQPAF